MMTFIFILGAFGGLWWPGIEVDAPKPGGGDPWWTRLLSIVVGGVSAIGVNSIQPVDMASVAGVFILLGAGKIGATVVSAVLSASKR